MEYVHRHQAESPKTDEELRSSWLPDAEKRSKTQLIVNKIATSENIKAEEKDVQKQVEGYLQEKAQTMLDDVLGLGKSVVRVTADLNFQQIVPKYQEEVIPSKLEINSMIF